MEGMVGANPRSYSLSSNSQSQFSFTLVEILVVLSILALLIAIVVPSFRKARESARSAKCAANMRSLIQTTEAYVGDWGRYPPSLMNTPGNWLYGWSGFDWLGVGHNSTDVEFAPTMGLYWPLLSVPEVFVCPADRVGQERGFSYSMNGRLGLLVPGSFVRNQTKQTLPRIAEAILPIFFEENAPREGCFSGRDMPVERHNNRTNIGYADGHVSSEDLDPVLSANGILRDIDFDPDTRIID